MRFPQTSLTKSLLLAFVGCTAVASMNAEACYILRHAIAGVTGAPVTCPGAATPAPVAQPISYTGANAGYALFNGAFIAGGYFLYTGASTTCPVGAINLSSATEIDPQIGDPTYSSYYTPNLVNLAAGTGKAHYMYYPNPGYYQYNACAPVPDITKLPTGSSNPDIYGTAIPNSNTVFVIQNTAYGQDFDGTVQYFDLTAVGGTTFVLAAAEIIYGTPTCPNQSNGGYDALFMYAGPMSSSLNFTRNNLQYATLAACVLPSLTFNPALGPSANSGVGNTILISPSGDTAN